MRGNWEQQDYCTGKNSDGTPKESFVEVVRDDGTGPMQGTRGDITDLKRKLDEGGDLLDCYEHDFATTARCYKALENYTDLKRRKLYRTEMTTGTWYWGKTCVGKSHKAFENYSPETHYVMEAADNGWWDGYQGEETVILNDFRGQIPYEEMLTLVDKWPKKVKRRCREPTPFISKHIIVTSSLHPEDVYNRRAERDDIAQLKRRFKVVELTKLG
jgi:hypothetical protein